MLIKNLPPRPIRKNPPLPQLQPFLCSQKNIDPELCQMIRLSKQSESKKNIHKNSSAKSLNSQRVYRPTSASSMKSRASSRQSNSSVAKHAKQGFLKNPPKITSFNWGIYEIKNGKYLSGMRTQKRREFASLTKIMNFVTILDLLNQFGLHAEEIQISVTQAASKINGTSASIKKGEKFNLENLFYGMMLPSGNDAAYQIAQIGGAIIKLCRQQKRKKELVYSQQFLNREIQAQGRANIIRYLSEMNRVSQLLGLKKSKWSNPHGLSNRQNVTTVNDLSILCTYAMKKNQFRKVVNTKEYSCITNYEKQQQDKENMNDQNVEQLGHKIMTWTNTNKMLWKGWNGVKTGITPNAGPCLAATVNKSFAEKDYEFLVILGGCKSMEQRWEEVNELVEWALSQRDQWQNLIDC